MSSHPLPVLINIKHNFPLIYVSTPKEVYDFNEKTILHVLVAELWGRLWAQEVFHFIENL